MKITTNSRVRYSGRYEALRRALFLLPLCASTLLMCQDGEANDITFVANYTVVAGGCTVTLSPSPLDFGSVSPQEQMAAIGQNWKFVHTKLLTVTLTECTATGAAGTYPTVTVTGQPAHGATDSADRKAYIFDAFDASNNQTGWGVVIGNNMTNPNLTDGDTTNLASPAVGGTSLRVGPEGSTVTSGASASVPVALACGAASDCTTDKLKTGPLHVSVGFEFSYK